MQRPHPVKREVRFLVEQRAMKKFLVVVFFCFPAFGQTGHSATGLKAGAAVFGSFISGGAPLTYSARTDNCVTGSESGCISGTTTGEAGSALIFQEGTSDPVPFYRLDTDTTPGNCSSYSPSVASNCATAGTPFVDPTLGAIPFLSLTRPLESGRPFTAWVATAERI